MFRREAIRYGNAWVRLLCCLAIAIGVANAVHFGLLDVWEAVGYDLIIDAGTEAYARVSETLSVLIVFTVSLMSSVFRIERPFAMVVYTLILEGVYLLAVAVTALWADTALPVVAPFLTLLGSTVFLETMAWSEERQRRRRLEVLSEARQQFVDMLVHDLRRRISSILMSFSLLRKRTGAGDARACELSDTIQVSAERTLIEINDLLAVRKMEEGKMSLKRARVRLGELLERSVEELRPAAELVGCGVRLLNHDDLTLHVDGGLFSRVIANLLWNALRHAPEGSDVKVGYERERDGGLRLHVTNGGDAISPEQQAVMFEAFVSSDDGPGSGVRGTGLGLTFCRLVMEAHAGRIGVESPVPPGPDGVRLVTVLPASVVMQP